MEDGKLIYYRAKDFVTGGFKKNEYYLYIEDDVTLINDNCKKIIKLWNGDNIQSVNSKYFVLATSTTPIKSVICVYPGINNTLKVGEKQYVYNINESSYKDSDYFVRYEIFYQYKWGNYPAEYFMDIDEYESLKEQGLLENKLKEIKETLDLKNGISEKSISANFIINLIDEKYKNKLSNTRIDEKILKNPQNDRLKKRIAIVTIFQTFFMPIIGIVLWKMNNHLLSIFMTILNLIVSELYWGYTLKRFSKNTKNIIEANYINDSNLSKKLSFETLGKIKYLECEVKALMSEGVSSDITSLIDESISITLKLVNNINDDNIEERVSEFLDNTIEYVKTLKENKTTENQCIENKLAQNIYNIIDRNNDVFKSMIKDNKALYKHI